MSALAKYQGKSKDYLEKEIGRLSRGNAATQRALQEQTIQADEQRVARTSQNVMVRKLGVRVGGPIIGATTAGLVGFYEGSNPSKDGPGSIPSLALGTACMAASVALHKHDLAADLLAHGATGSYAVAASRLGIALGAKTRLDAMAKKGKKKRSAKSRRSPRVSGLETPDYETEYQLGAADDYEDEDDEDEDHEHSDDEWTPEERELLGV